ncbi:GAF domain-containing sensor histidine kinase [Argonema galeatum]|uniref:GAF domain-containing sensor histidine kinase n=1 Tax=Argonema galeatum TaxID=2942762 RepID=UPI00201234FF|nr:GAF domain-containing protein [Argonema galeatum A003/A1]
MTERGSDLYQKLPIQIGRKIRGTLDIDTIWQETVDTLGPVLNVTRCIIYSYKNFSPQVPVVAEYRQEPFESMLGHLLWLADEPALANALAKAEPVIIEHSVPLENGASLSVSRLQSLSILAVATRYRNLPNGIISLHQCDRSRQWTTDEIELVQEIADQVGACVAHVNLHHELEESRQQAQEATLLKSQFLTTISHELRTPLNGTIGFLKLILDDMVDEPEEQREFTQEAFLSSLHLLNIINDILDIANLKNQHIQMELSAVKLDELLSAVEKLARMQVEKKNLSFSIELPATYDEIILYGNYQRLLQVMLNLVGNAIKFTNEGGVTISVEVLKNKVVFQNLELPGMVKIRVEDTGIGVPLEKLDKLFGIFTKGDGSLTSRFGGTGLGLSISQKLVEAMGGAVDFYSMGEDLGSTVTFTVPLYQEPVIISTDF